MRIAILTSSRAEYSIYYPLLKKLQDDPFFSVHIIAFGTHLSKAYGYTIENIKKDGFQIDQEVSIMPKDDSPQAISECIGLTIEAFSKIWNTVMYDMIFCLGDRYEMFAAVCATVPFNLPIAHIHGGETTLGAIDNVFRHSLSLMSKYHFTSTDDYKKRVSEVVGNDHVYNVGALSIDNIKNLKLFTIDEFRDKFKIDLNLKSILITFHPETVSYEKNKEYVSELIEALKLLTNYQLIITMPNADTMGNLVRQELNKFIDQYSNAIGIESFGTIGYLSCMKYCSFLLGNTSSGFVEASYFPKFVVNLGHRQEGRITTPNIFNCQIKKDSILSTIRIVEKTKIPKVTNLYGDGHAAEQIVEILKKIK